MKSHILKLRMLSTLCVAALTIAIAAPTSHAKQGADDPAGHNAGDDKGGKVPKAPKTPKAPKPPKVKAPKVEHPAGHA